MRRLPWLLLLALSALILLWRLTWLPGGAEDSAIEQPANGEISVALAAGGKLNVNDAASEELALLPGIGGKRAAAIIEERRQNGCFTSLGDLSRVRGIGPKSVEKFAEYLEATGCGK